MNAAVKAWAQRALSELDLHLHAHGAELHALAAAGTPASTTFALYPFEGTDYVHGLHALIRSHLLGYSRGTLEGLAVQAMEAFPYELGAFLPRQYRELWPSDVLSDLCARSGVELLADDPADGAVFYFLFRFIAALNALARPEPADALRSGRSGVDYAAKHVPEMMPVAAALLAQAQRFLPAT